MKYYIIALIIAFLIVTPLIVPVTNFLRKSSNKKLVKILILVLFGLIITTAIPLLMFDGQWKSLIDLILEGKIWFGLIIIGYLIALILLFFEKKIKAYPSLIAYLAAYISTWVVGQKYIPDNAFNGGNGDQMRGFLWVIIYLAIPIFSSLLYIGIIESYRKRIDISLGAKNNSASSLTKNFRINMPPYVYIVFGSFITILIIITGLDSLLNPVVFLIMAGLIILCLLTTINKSILLTNEMLSIPLIEGLKAILPQKKDIKLSEIDSLFVINGKFLQEYLKTNHDTNLEKNLSSNYQTFLYKDGGYREKDLNPYQNVGKTEFLTKVFLYIRNKSSTSYLFNVEYYSRKKLVELANRISLRNIKTEVHI